MARPMESPFLFPGTRDRRRSLNARWWCSKRFKPACERAGVPIKDVRHLWHALRHTLVVGLPVFNTKRTPLWPRGRKAVQRYVHLHGTTLKEAAERLAAIKPV